MHGCYALPMNESISTAYAAEDLLIRGNHYFAEIRIAIPSDKQVEQLDAWTTQVLLVELGKSDQGGANDVPAGARAFIARLVGFCQQLLLLGRVPAFDPPRVLSWSKLAGQPDMQGVKLGFEVLEHLAWDNYLFVLNFVLSTFQQLVNTPVTPDSTRELFERIEHQVMRPLHQLTSTGKSTMPVLAQAHARGMPWMHLGAGVYQLGWGSRARRLDRSSIDLDSAIGSRLVQNKVTCAALLRVAGLPAPVHEVVGDEAQAVRAAHQIGYPVVVKPTDRDRGEGITVDVSDDATLKQAFKHAHALAQNKLVIVERQVDGVCHRVFVAHGEVLYAVKRMPMSVLGDGVHSVRQLVDAQWAQQQTLPAWQRSELQPIDDLAMTELARAGWQPDTVPGLGVRVALRRIESTQWGGVDEEVTESMHPENRAIAIQAARQCGLAVAGVDIITTDIAQPWYTQGAIINEVNYAPLLGGGEISRRYIPTFLRALMPTDGKIPVEMFQGAGAEADALIRQTEWAKQGVRAYIASPQQVTTPQGQPMAMTAMTLTARIKALLCCPDVDALLIVQ